MHPVNRHDRADARHYLRVCDTTPRTKALQRALLRRSIIDRSIPMQQMRKSGLLGKVRRMRHVPSRIRLWWRREFDEPTILLSAAILVVGILLVSALYAWIPNWREGFFQGIFVEFNGMLFDVVVFGIIVASFIRRMERRQERQRQQEIIADFKKSDTEEGRLRLGGAVRRLNRLGITGIDFAGIEISDFSFSDHDITSIKGSTFYDGTLGGGSRQRVKLERVGFDYVDCQGVVFSKFNPLSALGVDAVFAELKDCNFLYADLSNAVFNGAHLEWTTEHPELFGVWHDDEDHSSFEPTHYSPFHNAVLNRASFVDVRFKNADFREVVDVLECDFTGAKGLESCLFADEKTKNAVIEMSKRVNATTV
ncbi:hypothetical protein GOL95_32195 [Sinorhizobium medicae]|nr:hypothetical protein [Sinorhizobium medicae]MDX0839933.1 hypothetical protein [Sinorhizobium medicae]MDX1120692.1 hypothetical protein [Sinorhizobium medicae]MDX1244514.1 hypothetical protein [Sinorhizobium medicae]